MTRLALPDLALCRIAAFTSMAVGPLGMFVSMVLFDSPRGPDVAAGVAGFVAGAVLAAGGLVSLVLILPKVPAPA